ncbi:hypothetical protein MIC97_20540 [Aquamicrobium sp. NLF2-7]|uniref:hypothetical protein n=1 Tax=Aquamicrobium sp. NLF2-7 TaxID=2918753 RepID=UPI001EFAF0E0|nr:hypothetical protein [Aquamicrobium sp. NLF2-7]MCG8273876.1 hypothetical protein [Aquamicrobium sp. NLF2-7]
MYPKVRDELDAELAGCHPADSVANPATFTSDPVQFRVALPAANPPDNQETDFDRVAPRTALTDLYALDVLNRKNPP